jgi:hypothetical protein
MGKAGRPKSEKTEVMSFRVPSRLRNLMMKASKSFRSSNEYLNSMIEDNLVKKGLLEHKNRKFPIDNNKKKRK